MRVETIKKLVESNPFKPFTIHLEHERLSPITITDPSEVRFGEAGAAQELTVRFRQNRMIFDVSRIVAIAVEF